MSATPRRTVLLGSVVAAVLLLWAAPTPAAALRQLRDTGNAADPTAPLLALLSLVAWCLAAWLVLTVVLIAGAHLPGLAGRALAAVSRRVAPAAVRRAVEVTLGLTVAVGTLGASPALAAPGPPHGPAGAPAVSLDWAAVAPTEAGAPRNLDWPDTTGTGTTAREQARSAPTAPEPAAAAAAAAEQAASAPGEPVVVRPGDTLWDLAEQDLAARGLGAPTDAEVAQAWPSWWAANREAVGDDPDLLSPGTHLTPPPAYGT